MVDLECVRAGLWKRINGLTTISAFDFDHSEETHECRTHTHKHTHTHSLSLSHTHTHALFHSHTHVLSHLDQASVLMRTTSPDKVSFKAGEYPEEVKKKNEYTLLFLRSRSDALLSTSCENAISAAKQNDFSPAFIRTYVCKSDTLHVCSCVTVMSAHSVQLWWKYGIMWNAFSKLNLYLTQCHCHCHIHPPPPPTHTHTHTYTEDRRCSYLKFKVEFCKTLIRQPKVRYHKY